MLASVLLVMRADDALMAMIIVIVNENVADAVIVQLPAMAHDAAITPLRRRRMPNSHTTYC